MHWTKRLQQENKELKQGILMLKRYAQSKKFNRWDYIHRNDVLLRIGEVLANIDMTEVEE